MIQIWQVPSECSPSNLVVLGIGSNVFSQTIFVEIVQMRIGTFFRALAAVHAHLFLFCPQL